MKRPAFLADRDLAPVWDALPEARVVGGAVRDALIDRTVSDIDLATPQTPRAVSRALKGAGLRVIPTGLAHGTVTALSGGRGFEVTTLRRDVATDGRHATVAFTDDWLADAARRDFTFNAMSMARDGTLFDPFEGAADLAAGRVRFVGDPAQRIAEDFLRVLRYCRFLARYGRTEPDAATMQALADEVPGLARLSPERVWSELKKILAAPAPLPAIALMRRLGILEAVLPEASDIERLRIVVAAGAPARPLLRLAALAPNSVQLMSERLRMSGRESQRLLLLRREEPALDETASDDDIRRALAEMDADVLIERLWLAQSTAELRERVAALPRPIFPVQGRDLLAAGLPPGPELGHAMSKLRRSWLAGGCLATRETLLRELARLRGG